MRDVIVSFASKGRERYDLQLLRLIDSCVTHWKGDLLIYSPDHDLAEYKGVTIHKGWPKPLLLESYTHKEMPYQFKTCMIELALELGYERIIWLDSSMQLKKDLTPLFDSPTGIATFHNLGHPTWKYISDKALDLLGVSRETVLDIPQIWGGAFALDFTRLGAKLFFDELKEYSVNGSFKESGSTAQGFIAHRHDQSVMSVLLDGKCDMLPYGHILCPPHDTTGEYGKDPFLVCRGL